MTPTRPGKSSRDRVEPKSAAGPEIGRLPGRLPDESSLRHQVEASDESPQELGESGPLVWAQHHSLLLLALFIAVLFHGSLLLNGSYQRTYDAWVHMFFADHYQRSWWSTWDTRWYTGFTTVSYPPGAHQCIALLGKVFGLRLSFVLVQLFAVVNLTAGVYRWSRIWVSERSAGWAALLLALSPAVAETVHLFGQLPTTLSLGFLLQSLPFAHRWITRGERACFAVAVACIAACTAGHHFTTLFGAVFFVAPVMVVALLTGTPDALPLRQRVRALLAPPLFRAVVFGVTLIASLFVVVLPYWLWSSRDPITQIPIPHGSRDSFLLNRTAGLMFFVIPWGIALLGLPDALVRGFRSRAWPLAGSLLLLTILGTGGTTAIPRLMLGGAFDILTLDRFTFWATIAILPFLGSLIESSFRGRVRALLQSYVGWSGLAVVRALLAVFLVASAVFAATLSQYRHFQPAYIDPQPIASFMEKDQHSRWRYLLLGFGDQMAWTSAQMTAGTVDGNYHSARRLPELTSQPIERLEGAKYSGVPGIGSLQQFLSVPRRYSLKFVFSNDHFYDPLLHFAGWHSLGTLANGVEVWEKSDVPPIRSDTSTREIPMWQRRMWGVVPMTSILSAFVLLSWALIREQKQNTRTWTESPALLPDSDATSLVHQPGKSARRVTRVAFVGVLAGLLIGPPAAIAMTRKSVQGSPSDVVSGYITALDQRRFSDAYALLDTETRPSRDDFEMDLHMDGGLIASFAKLSRLRSAVVATVGEQATVRADATYQTSVASYPTTSFFRAVQRKGLWRIQLESPDARVTPATTTSRRDVNYTINYQPKQRTVEGRATAPPQLIDRPLLELSNVRTLQRKVGTNANERTEWIVIGRVENVDAEPADVMITAELRDRAGGLLASYDAAKVTQHKLLPGESAPFRIDFESIAGTVENEKSRNSGPIEFDPLGVTPLWIPKDREPASAAVFATAVVLDKELRRGLQVVGAHVEYDGAGKGFLVGSIRNDSTAEASVPMVLVSYKNGSGELAWVDSVYLEKSIRPQMSVPFRVPIAKSESLRKAKFTTHGVADSLADPTADEIDDGVALPAGEDFASASLQATSFSRDGGTL